MLHILRISFIKKEITLDNENNGGIPRPDGKVNAIDTDYQIGQDNIALKVGPFGLDIHNRVFLIPLSLCHSLRHKAKQKRVDLP